jgi:hypothetical protein
MIGLNAIILRAAENFKIDEQDCGLDFFDPTDSRYEYRRKKEWKNTAARHSSPVCGIAIFLFWIRTLRGLRYPGIEGLSEHEPILKIFAIYC